MVQSHLWQAKLRGGCHVERVGAAEGMVTSQIAPPLGALAAPGQFWSEGLDGTLVVGED